MGKVLSRGWGSFAGTAPGRRRTHRPPLIGLTGVVLLAALAHQAVAAPVVHLHRHAGRLGLTATMDTVALTLNVANSATSEFFGNKSFAVTSDDTSAAINPEVVLTGLTWTGQVPGGYYASGHPDPFTTHDPLPVGALSVPLSCQQSIGAGGMGTYVLNVTLPAGTLPGVYEGMLSVLYDATSPGTCPPASGDAVDTLSLAMLTVTVPEQAIADIDANDHLTNGVGSSSPAGFYVPAAAGEMHLGGVTTSPATLAGQFLIANPNTDLDADNDGTNDVNHLLATPKPRYTRSDKQGAPNNTAQGNIDLDKVRFQFTPTVMQNGVDPTPNITITPAEFRMPLAASATINVSIATAGLPSAPYAPGHYEGFVLAYYDANADGSYEGGTDAALDAFLLRFQVVAPESLTINTTAVVDTGVTEFVGAAPFVFRNFGAYADSAKLTIESGNLNWVDEIPGGYYASGHSDPYRHDPIPSSLISITPNCQSIGDSLNFDVTVGLPAGTLPGEYRGTFLLRTSSAAAGCPAPPESLTTVDSIAVLVTVPEQIIADINGDDGRPDGVGSSLPPAFYRPAAPGQMNLGSLFTTPATLTGTFTIANANTVPDLDNNGLNDTNGLPATPKPRFARSQMDDAPTDTAQGNVTLDAVRFRYFTIVGSTLADTHVTFSADSVALGLGDMSTMQLFVNTAGLPGRPHGDGIYSGYVQAYLDANHDGAYDGGDRILDAFELNFQVTEAESVAIGLNLSTTADTGLVEFTGSAPVTAYNFGGLTPGALIALQAAPLPWTGEVPGGYLATHTDTYTHNPLAASEFTITPACVAAPAVGDSVIFTVNANVLAGTLPGTYAGWFPLVSSSDSVNCPPVVGATVVDSVYITVTVPEQLIADIDARDSLTVGGVGGVNPPSFCTPSAAGEMHLAGLAGTTMTLNGTFRLANPNTRPDTTGDGLNDVNGLPALPNPRFVRSQGPGAPTDTAQGNVTLQATAFRFLPNLAPGPDYDSLVAAVSFTPLSAPLALGETAAVGVTVNPVNLPGFPAASGMSSGTVQAYVDANGNGAYDAGERILDAFTLRLQLTLPESVNVVMQPVNAASDSEFQAASGTFTYRNFCTNDTLRVCAVAGPITWASEVPGGYYTTHPDPYASLHGALTGQLSITPSCQTNYDSVSFAAAFSVPTGTLPGVYRGVIHLMTSHDTTAAVGDTSLVTTDSVFVSVTVPEVITACFNTNDSLVNGIGSSNPPGFFIPNPVTGAMHLAGYGLFPIPLVGTFEIANPNTRPDADSNSVNDVNGLPAEPRVGTNFPCVNALQGNVALDDVRFRFAQESGPALPAGAITFSPAFLDSLGLGQIATASVFVNASAIPPCLGPVTGIVTAYVDLNGDTLTAGDDRVLDTFELDLEFRNPDLDIHDNLGNLAANTLDVSYVAGQLTPTWSIVATNSASADVNLHADPADGPGCETLIDLSVYNPSVPDTASRYTLLGTDSTGVVTGGTIRLQNVNNPGVTIGAQVFLVNTSANAIPEDSTVTIQIRVTDANAPSGTYAPYYGANDSRNGWLYIAGVGAEAQNAVFGGGASGLSARYNGNPNLGTLVDSFLVNIHFTGTAVCALGLAPNSPPLMAMLSPGMTIVLPTLTIVNTGTVAQSGLTVSGTVLAGPNGATLPVNAVLTSTTLGDTAGTTQLQLNVTAMPNQPPGPYTGSLVVASSCGGSVTIPITVDVTTKMVAFVKPVGALSANPGQTVCYTVPVRNSGTAPINAGELNVAVSAFTMAGGVQTGAATITPNPSTVALAPGQVADFQVCVAVPADQRAGTFSAVVSATPGMDTLALVLNVNPLVSVNVPGAATVTVGQPPIPLQLTNTGNTDVTVNAVADCGDVSTVPTLIVAPTTAGPVAPGSVTTFNLSATATTAVPSGQYACTLTLTTTPVGGGTAVVSTVQVTVFNPRVASLALVDTLIAVGGCPGDKVTLQLRLRNTGNTDILPGELTSLTVATFTDSAGRVFRTENVMIPNPASLFVRRGSDTTVTVMVTIPQGQSAGTYRALVVLAGNVSGTSVSTTATAAINVCRTRAIEFSQNPVRCDLGRCTVQIGFGAGASGIEIYDLLGHLIRSFTIEDQTASGVVTWDLTDDDGNPVASGTYTVVLRRVENNPPALTRLVVIR